MKTVKEKPIPFNGQMVRLNRAGLKTCTRRTSGLKHINESPDDWTLGWHPPEIDTGSWLFFNRKTGEECWIKNPFGEKGDHLWVRETWQGWNRTSPEYDEWEPLTKENRSGLSFKEYFAEYGPPTAYEYQATSDSMGPWNPSIFMLREISRDNLEITSTRPPERVQEISDDDAIAEGAIIMRGEIWDRVDEMYQSAMIGSPIECFANYWDTLKGKKYPWDSNPWVWPIEYKVI